MGERLQQYLNCVAFPSTRSAGSATAIFSAVMNPFEWSATKSTLSRSTGDTLNYPAGSGYLGTWGAFGAAKIWLRMADKSKITGDSVLLNVYVSFDKGISYQQWQSFRLSGIGGTTAGDTGTFVSIPFAPRMYVTATLGSTMSLTAGHGLAVDVEFEEYGVGLYRTVTPVTWPSVTYADSQKRTALSPDSFNIGDSTKIRYSNSVTISQYARPQKVALIGWVNDRTVFKVTSPAYQNTWVQSSMDGTHWYYADSISLAKPTKGTGIFVGEEELIPWQQVMNGSLTAGTLGTNGGKTAGTGVLSKYLRLQYGPKYVQQGGYTISQQSSTNTGPRYWVVAFY